MYAEVRVFEDDGTPFKHLPYQIPVTDIDIQSTGAGMLVHYKFTFELAKLEKPEMVITSRFNYDEEKEAVEMAEAYRMGRGN